MITFIPGTLPVRPPHPDWCEHDSIAPDLSALTHRGCFDVSLGAMGDAGVQVVRHDDGCDSGASGVSIAWGGREIVDFIDPLAALRFGVAVIRASQAALAGPS